MKYKFKKRRALVTLAVVLGSVICSVQGQTKKVAQIASHFLPGNVHKIAFNTDGNNIQITTSRLPGFSNCRQYLGWRNQGVESWTQEFASDMKKEIVSAREHRLISKIGPGVATILIRQLEDNVLEFSGTLTNKSNKIIELARFHYLHGVIANELNYISSGSFSVARRSDKVKPKRISAEESWKHFTVDFPMLHDPIHEESNWHSSSDIGIFASAANKPGWFMGYTGPCTAYGEIGFKTQVSPSIFYSGILLDNIILESDSTRVLEKFILYAGDWQDAMNYWVRRTASEMNVKPQLNPLTGYCSWYQKNHRVTPDDILRAANEFKNLPVPPGGRTIQIDDGFQIMPGNWAPNKKFDSVWDQLPKRIAETGSIPGLWLAPNTIYDAHPMLKEHPEILQQFEKGVAPVSFPNWGWANDDAWFWAKQGAGRTYSMDIDRPEAQAFMRDIMKKSVSEGWRYFKLDFTYMLSTARIAYNRKKTRLESLRDLYKMFREVCGPDILINACVGGNERYALGNADIIRLGGDIGGNWNTVQNNLRDLLSRSYTNGYWWQADPDVFFMRTENSKLNAEESFLLTGSIALIGGVFLTSDFPSQWSMEARRVIDSLWTADGPKLPSRQYVLYDDNNTIRAYLLSYEDSKRGPQHRIGIYNWSDKEEAMTIAFKDLNLKPGLNWKASIFFHQEPVTIIDNSIMITRQPPHSLRIINLNAK